MFVRFRARNTRLYVSLAEAHRSDGAVRQRHVASLGVVSLDPNARKWETLRERTTIWQELHGHLSRLSIDGERAQRLMAAVQARVAYPTPEETGNAERLEAEHDTARWQNIRRQTTGLIGAHEQAIAHHKEKIAELQHDAEREAKLADDAAAKAHRLSNY